jgi:hypothetical protein
MGFFFFPWKTSESSLDFNVKRKFILEEQALYNGGQNKNTLKYETKTNPGST